MTTSQVRESGGAAIALTLNGKPSNTTAGLTVQDFLRTLDLEPATVVVELNRTILRRDDYVNTEVHDGDTIELVHFVGGG